MFWVNIDKPTKKCTIHENCTYVNNKKETPLKGIGELKTDGGWLEFNTHSDAVSHCKTHFGNFNIITHCSEKDLPTSQQFGENRKNDVPAPINHEKKPENNTFIVDVNAMIWVNVDKPTKKCTIHRDCTYVNNKKETPLKGIGKLKRDGGWLSFNTEGDAEAYCRSDFSSFSMSKHCTEGKRLDPIQTGAIDKSPNNIAPKDIYDKLVAIEEKLEDIKKQNEELKIDIEEKIDLIYEGIRKNIDEMRKEISAEQYNQYLTKFENLIDYWDRLDNGTRDMLPMAEYLYDVILQKGEPKEYSPVILHYCKCLENELLAKIFRVFTDSNKKFRGEIGKCSLGRMKVHLEQSMLKNIKPIYKELRNFLRKNFDLNGLLTRKFLGDLENITENYRNKAAHINVMSGKEAEDCKSMVILMLDELMELNLSPVATKPA